MGLACATYTSVAVPSARTGYVSSPSGVLSFRVYTPDELDRVFRLGGAPRSSVGAPLPLVVGNEYITCVSFYCQNTPPAWNGENARSVTPASEEPWAIVSFIECYAHFFGPPNDEAFAGHPLYSRGLMPYDAYIVGHSSWLRELERMNSIHPHHDRATFLRGQHHFILAFHDSTFECIASRYHVKRGAGPLTGTVAVMSDHLREPPVDTVEPTYSEPVDPSEPKRRPRWWRFGNRE